MAGMNGKESIVEGDEEKRGWKRVNEDEDKDTHLTKRGKVEGKGDGTQKEEEEVKEGVNDKVERLCRRLKKEPRWLRYETEDVIRYLDVDDIISWALKHWRVGEKACQGYLCLEMKPGEFVPSPEKVDRLMRLMLLCGVEKLKAVDLYILYNNFPRAAFACMLLRALDSYSKRHPECGWTWYTKEMRANIGKACGVLMWKVFAHAMYKLTLLPVFKCTISTTTGTSEEEEEDGTQKKAAEKCDVCNGKGKHSGVYGYYCSYWQSVPCGVTVGPGHIVMCDRCGYLSRDGNSWVRCHQCASRKGKAVPQSILWDRDF